MKDFIKGEILNADIKVIKNNEHLEFHSRYSDKTGEVDDSRQTAHCEGLTFTIIDNRKVFMQGSLSKFFFGNNYQNLTHTDTVNAIEKLRMFNIDPKDFVFQNIEVGVCINTENLDPTKFLMEEVIDYKITEKEIRTFKGNGYMILFPLNNYVVKLYDKGKQSNLTWNALKFEIRIKKMVHIKRLGIRTLDDLYDKGKWFLLKAMLIKTFDDIIASKARREELTAEEFDFYILNNNQRFWLINWPNSKKYTNGCKDIEYQNFRKKYFNRRSEFIELIKIHGFDRNKQFILSKITQELDRLIES